jgi:hypothetical protein
MADRHPHGRTARRSETRELVIPAPDEARITAAAWSGLAHAAKQFLWSMAVNPPTGRRRLSPASLQTESGLLKTVIGWMALDGLAWFREIDRAAVDRLRAWLLVRQGRRNRLISPRTVAIYMVVLKDIYRQPIKLDDAIVTDPFPDETTYEAAGLTRANEGTIPFIPDTIAVALLNAALKWVEDHGPTIVEAEALGHETRAFDLTRGAFRQASYHVRKALKRAGLSGPLGDPLDGACSSPLLRRLPHPRIVNIASTTASLTLASDPTTMFASSKAAVTMLTVQYSNAFRRSANHAHVKINTATPGHIATDLNNFGGNRTVAQGATIVVDLATLSDDGPSGGYFNDAGVVPW